MRNTEYDDKPTYSIYQLKPTERDLLFMDYKSLKRKGLKPNIDLYDLVYLAEDSTDFSLNKIYERFNIDHPSDFRGHSLSVSDVIVKFDGETKAAYYVDSFGFQPLPDFFDSSAANKKDMEM